MVAPSPYAFLDEGMRIIRKKRFSKSLNLDRQLKSFREIFGTHPLICAEIWELSNPVRTVDKKVLIKHLLWTCYQLKVYGTEAECASYLEIDEDTFRKWTSKWRIVISKLSLEVIRWNDRFINREIFWTFVVDGVHFKIQEPRPFWKKWYSHKGHGPALNYEVCTAISTGSIVWIRGPFPASFHDGPIFDRDLAFQVQEGEEKGVGDRGYIAKKRAHLLQTPWWPRRMPLEDRDQVQKIFDNARARHEQTNSQFKAFHCLKDAFRHDVDLHQDFFYSVAVIVELEIKLGLRSQWDVEEPIK